MTLFQLAPSPPSRTGGGGRGRRHRATQQQSEQMRGVERRNVYVRSLQLHDGDARERKHLRLGEQGGRGLTPRECAAGSHNSSAAAAHGFHEQGGGGRNCDDSGRPPRVSSKEQTTCGDPPKLVTWPPNALGQCPHTHPPAFENRREPRRGQSTGLLPSAVKLEFRSCMQHSGCYMALNNPR